MRANAEDKEQSVTRQATRIMAALVSPILSGRSGDPRLLISCEREVGHRHSWPLLRVVSPAPESPAPLLRLAASAAVFLSVGVRACTASHLPSSPSARRVMEHLPPPSIMEAKLEDPAGGRDSDTVDISENEFKSAFDKWRSKTYALTVPLRIIALRGSIPPAWIKDFVQVQGKRLKLQTESRGSLDAIFQELSSSLKGHVGLKSAVAADIVTIADSWLDSAIRGGMIEPLEDAEKQEWFNCLSNKWKECWWRDRS